MEYNKLTNKIKSAPGSWLPALLITLTKVAYKKDVFQPGGASRLIQKVEAKLPFNKEVANVCAECGGPLKAYDYYKKCTNNRCRAEYPHNAEL